MRISPPSELERYSIVVVDACCHNENSPLLPNLTVVFLFFFLAGSQAFRLFASCVAAISSSDGDRRGCCWFLTWWRRKNNMRSENVKTWLSSRKYVHSPFVAVLLPGTVCVCACVCMGINSLCMKRDLTDMVYTGQHSNAFCICQFPSFCQNSEYIKIYWRGLLDTVVA